MESNVLEILKRAIEDRRCVAVRYRGQQSVRVVEPHAAYTNDAGELVVDCYQTRGFSASGRRPPFWKRLRLKHIGAISVLKQAFEPRLLEGFSANKARYKRGLVAIVEADKPSFMHSPQALREMGPFLPEGMRKYH